MSIDTAESSGAAYVHMDDGIVAAGRDGKNEGAMGDVVSGCKDQGCVVKEEVGVKESEKVKYVGSGHSCIPANILPPKDKLLQTYESA